MMDSVVDYQTRPRDEDRAWYSTLVLCFREARPIVQLIFLLRYLAAVAVASPGAVRLPGAVELRRILLGTLSWMAATFFTYLYNGVMDIAEDRVNGSRRPIALGYLDPDSASLVAYAAAAVATVAGFAVSTTTGLLVVAFLICGYAYSGWPFYLKRATGGTMTAVLVLGAATYAGGYSVVGPGGRRCAELVAFGAAMSLWMCLVGALAKDFSDVAGDRAAGRRPLLVRWGERRTRLVLALAASMVSTGLLLVAVSRYPLLLPPALALQAGGLAVAALSLVSRWSSGDRSSRRRPYRAFMIAQYLAHLSLFGVVFVSYLV
jgi:4-hydroxybenzoate polyprenyltransferase